MLGLQTSLLILTFLNITLYRYTNACAVVSRKLEVRNLQNKMIVPLKVKDEIIFSQLDNDLIITSALHNKPCNITLEPDLGSRPEFVTVLGNKKMLVATEILGNFYVVDYNNCSSYTVTPISNNEIGLRQGLRRPIGDKISETLITYYDTFDIFDPFNKTCMPCRYNDQGRKINLDYSLKMDHSWKARHWNAFRIRAIKNSLNLDKGYVQILTMNNNTNQISLLDSHFNLLVGRVFDKPIIEYVVKKYELIVCYVTKNCSDSTENDFIRECVECQLLNSKLKTTKTYTMDYGAHRSLACFNAIICSAPNVSTYEYRFIEQFNMFVLNSEKTIFAIKIFYSHHSDKSGGITFIYLKGTGFQSPEVIRDDLLMDFSTQVDGKMYVIELEYEYCIAYDKNIVFAHEFTDTAAYFIVQCVNRN